MAEEIRNVALIGAGGNIGPSILEALKDAKFNVTVISRASSSAAFDGVRVVKSDFSESSLVEAFKGQDAVISTIASLAIDAQSVIVEAAVKAGVKRFIPSEFGSDTDNENARKIAPAFEGKKKIVDLAQARAAENPNFSWTGAVSGPFFDWGLQVGFLGFDLKNNSATIWDDGSVRFSVSTLAQIGRAVVGILKHPAETKNKYIYFNSFTTSQSQILAALEKASGKKYTVNHTTFAKELENARAALAKGDIQTGIFGTIASNVFSTEPTGNDFTVGDRVSNKILGLSDENFEEVVKGVVEGAKA
ncbi:MAG: hypothetical protein M1825_000845 [Sarcosagium campestre]|nr:MAG: hypothetical protein M1825_000845 [Sarcosagium campestre]